MEVPVKEVRLVAEELDLLELSENQVQLVELVVTVDPVLHQLLQDLLFQEAVEVVVVVLLHQVQVKMEAEMVHIHQQMQHQQQLILVVEEVVVQELVLLLHLV